MFFFFFSKAPLLIYEDNALLSSNIKYMGVILPFRGPMHPDDQNEVQFGEK